MQMSKTCDFPYPVLRNDSHIESGYKEELFFKINVEEPIIQNGRYVFTIRVSHNSNVIRDLLALSKASIYVTCKTSYLSKTIRVPLGESKVEVPILISDLPISETIVFSSLISSELDFELEYNNEFLDYYNFGDSISIARKDCLALSNEVKFFFNLSGKTIIKMQVSSSFENSFSIDTNDLDFIIIHVGKDFKKAYDYIDVANVSDKKIINTSLMYFALINVFTKIFLNGSIDYNNRRWYQVIDASLKINNIDLDEKKIEMGDDFDIDQIYELVDDFFQQYFKKLLIKVGGSQNEN